MSTLLFCVTGAWCVRGNHDEKVISYAVGVNTEPRPDKYSYIDQLTP